MRNYFLIILVLLIASDLAGQGDNRELSGQVSFVSTNSVYVKFRSTKGITAGDTLFTRTEGRLIPLLVVKNLSSLSCVCTPITPAAPAVADFVVARIKAGNAGDGSNAAVAATVVETTDMKIVPDTSEVKDVGLKQHIGGSFSVHSYSDFSNTGADNSQRFRYTLSLDAANIGNSKFSFETYTSFRHKLGEWEEVKNNIFSALKIFNLALIYEPDKTTRISAGRRINPRLSNIGASDGLQIEKSFGGFSVGALAGARPDYEDYGFNSSLLQFGGYLGFNTRKQSRFSESSLAFMQQMNGGNVDRRFIYFQHSNSIVRNLYFIGTFEADLYKLRIDTVNNTETPVSGFDLTGLYLSLRYRISSKFSVSGSYDARKNVVYYETYKTFVDRMLEDEMRQGFRLQANYRITRNLNLGIQTGYRFLDKDPRPARNLYGYFTWSNIPALKIAATISATYTESSYMNGNIYSAILSRGFFSEKLQASLGYRYFDYSLPENSIDEVQHIGEANLYWQFAGKTSLSLNYEGTFEQQNKFNRLYVQIRRRF